MSDIFRYEMREKIQCFKCFSNVETLELGKLNLGPPRGPWTGAWVGPRCVFKFLSQYPQLSETYLGILRGIKKQTVSYFLATNNLQGCRYPSNIDM